jgi:membrane-bound lytic murein transglycosylase F
LDKGFSISTIEPETDIPTSEFLQRIVDHEYDVAMVSARAYIHAGKFHDVLKVVASVNDKPLHRWSVNQQNTELNMAAITFLRKEFQGEFFNISYKRNFPEKQKKIEEDFYISPYDELVAKYAEEYQFDWRLILAQMYQESQFKPSVRSDSGAKGLMQIMPRTAKELGVTKVEDPEIGIKAGLKYMNILRGRYGDELSVSERNWFTLASYNAGFERIEDARKFAKKLELDPDRWFGNVESAMQKLAKPENRQHTRFGYCRCGQTVTYVRNIRKLYNSYIQLTDPLIIASAGQRLLTDNVSGLPRSPF